MKRKFSVKDSTNPNILAAAKSLTAVGLGEFAEYYYEDEGGACPFFFVSRPFAKEQASDPDEVRIYLDVDNEYTVCTLYGHEHYNTPGEAADLIRKLYDKELAEVAVMYDEIKICVYTPNHSNPEDNVKSVMQHFESIMNTVNNYPLGAYNNAHFFFKPFAPYNLQVHAEKATPVAGRTRYIISCAFGEQPEYYL